MKIDSIAKEELCRSVVIFGISLIATAFIIATDYLPLPSFLLLPLPLTITAAYFSIMVRYRRKEHLYDPNPVSILRHALRSGEQREEKTKQRRAIVEKVVDAILIVTIFLVYLYASLADSINQALWLPVLVIIVILLTRIVFIDGGERRINLARWVAFYLTVSGVLLLRYLALGYPTVPLLQALALVGIVSFPILYIWERRHAPTGTD